MTQFKRKVAGLCVAVALAAPQFASAGIGVDITAGGSAIVNPPFTLGWAFDLAAGATLTSLAIWDEGGNGLAERHEVGLWNGAGVLLASTIMGAGASGDQVIASVSGLGSWRFNDVAPLALGAGHYVVGAVAGNDAFRTFVQSIVTDAAISNFDSGKYANGGFAFPNRDEASDFSLFGANLILNGTPPVPEPETLALLGLGLLGLGIGRRKKA